MLASGWPPNIRWLREHRNYNDIDWLGTISDHKKRSKENEKSEDENQPKVIVNHRRTLTNVDDDTNPTNGEQPTNLHLIESKPTQVKRNSVKELTKIFSKPLDKKPAPPPPKVNFRENVPTNTKTYGRLPSMKTTRDMDISCGEGRDSDKKPELGLVGLEGKGKF